jgi:hypothetical protein
MWEWILLQKERGIARTSKSSPEMISKKISKNPTAQKKNQNKITLRAHNIKSTELKTHPVFSTAIGSFLLVLSTSHSPCRHCRQIIQ